MVNTESFKSNVNRFSFTWWVLANTVALPILLIPESVGEFLLGIFAVMTDGMPVGVIGYIIALIILAFSGFFIGAWLGFWQWLVLRKQIPQIDKWVLRSSIGVAIGAPISWMVYGAIFVSPIVNRPDGIYFSFWYGYLAFGIFLGLSVGLSQWLALRRLFNKADLWIVTLPICFTLGFAFADSFFMPDLFNSLIQLIAGKVATLIPNELIHYDLFLIAVINSIMALIGIGLVTGVLLDWLLRLSRKQTSHER